jgi:hypothetical protein
MTTDRSTQTALSERGARRVRLAIVFTAVALVLGATLLIKETAYIFTAFMFLGPTLLLAAIVLLGWTILEELREKRVL